MANQIKYQVGFDVNKGDLNGLKQTLQQISQMTAKDLVKIGSASDLKIARKELLNIQDQAKNVQKALNYAFNSKLNTVSIDKFKAKLNDLNSGGGLQKVHQQFSKLGAVGEGAFRKLAVSTLGVNKQMRQTNTILDKMATTFGNTLKWNIASSAINSVSRSIEQAWGYAKSLDSSLNSIQIVTNKSADQMAKFAEQANDAAKDLGKTTTDYTDAALIYAQQGLNDEQIAQRTDLTLKTANVTKQSVDQVSEQLTAVWNGYKASTDQAEIYIDRLAAIAATTASDLGELSTGMSKVASAANQMGVSQEQLAAQLSTIITATRQAPESVGTALRTVYARISDIQAGIEQDGTTLGNYSGKMAELGINILDANGKLRDMGEVIEQIGGKWEGMTREQQVSLAQTMAGQRQYSNLMALFENFDQYNKSMETAANAAGTLERQNAIYLESTAAHLQTLKASVEDIYDSFIDTDSINSYVDILSGMATTFADFLDSIGGGGQLLRSLGAIALSVFSEQIGRSIVNTTTNLQFATKQAEEFKQALSNNLQIQGIQKLDSLTRKLLEDQELVLQIQKGLSPEQFNGLIGLTQKMGEFGTQVEVGKEKLQQYQNILNTLGQGDLGTKLFGKDQLASTMALDDIEDAMQVQKMAFQEFSESISFLNEKVNELKENLESVKTDSAENENKEYQQSIEMLQNEIADYLNLLDELNNKNALGKYASGFEKLKKEAGTLGRDYFKTEEEYTKALQDFANKTSRLGDRVNKNRQEILKEALKSGEFGDLKAEIQKARNNGEQLGEEFRQGIEKGIKTQQAQLFSGIVGGLGQVSMGIQQIQNLGSIWANSELSQGQKILQTITNLSFSIPMLVNGFNKLKEALSSIQIITKASQALRTLNQKNIASSVEQTVAVVAGKAAEKIATDQETQSEIINSGAKEKNAQVTGLEATASIANAGAKQLETEANLKLTASELMKQAAMNGTLLTSTQAVAMLTSGEIPARLMNSGAIGKETALLVDNTIQKGANAGATGIFAAAEQGAAGATGILNTALTTLTGGGLAGLLSVLGVAAAALAAVGIGVKIWQQQKKNAMEAAQKTQQAEQKIQQQIKSHDELYASLEDLDNQYRSGQITRAELQSSVAELTAQYGDQDQAVQKLKNSYLGLSTAIEQAKKDDRDELISSNEREIAALQDQYKNNINAKKKVNVRETNPNKTDQKILDELAKRGINPTITSDPSTGVQSYDFHLNSLKDAANLYQNLNEIIKETKLSSEDLADASIYQGTMDILNQFIEDIDTLNQKIKQNKEQGFQNQIDAAKESGIINPDKVKSLQDYLNLYQTLTDMAKGDTDIVNNAMAKNFPQLLNQYGDAAEVINKIKEAGYELTDPSVIEEWSDLQKQKFLSLDPSVYDSYSELKDVLQQIANLNFDNLGGLSIPEIDKALNAARTNYSFLQNTQNSLKDGGSISQQDYTQLTQNYPQLDQFLEQALDGTAHLKTSAEEFNQAVNNIKMQPFQTALQAIQNQLDAFGNKDYQNFQPASDTLKQNAADLPTQKQSPLLAVSQESLGQDQLNYITKFGDMNQQLHMKIQGWKQAIQEGGEAAKKAYGQMSQEVKKVSDNTEQSKKKYDELKEKKDSLEDAMYDARHPMDEDIDIQQKQDLIKLLDEEVEKNDELDDSLKGNKDALGDLAEEMLRYKDSIQDVSKNYDKWQKTLNKSKKGLADAAEITGQLKDAYGDMLDIDASQLSEEFLTNADNLQLMKEAAEGSQEAYDQLAEAANEDIVTHLELSDEDMAKFQSELDDVQDLMDKNNFPDLQVGADLDTGNFLGELTELVNAAGMTADQAEAYLSNMGIDAEVVQHKTEGVEEKQQTGFQSTLHPTSLEGTMAVPQTIGNNLVKHDVKLPYTVYSAAVEPQPTGVVQDIKENSAFTLEVKSAKKKSGGGFKQSQAKHGGGGGGKGSGKGGCFAAQTLIALSHNKYKYIEDVKVGDIVLSYNTKTKMNQYSIVNKTMIHDVEEDIYTLQIENDFIVATGIHPVYIIKEDGFDWIEVSDLKIGDLVLFADGTIHKILNITKEYKEIRVYNFEVSKNHNYYVGINKILVHNKGGGKKSKAEKKSKISSDKLEKVENKKDPYYTVNKALSAMERTLKRISKDAEKVFGPERIKKLKEQVTQLDKINKKLKEKEKIQKSELERQQKQLKKNYNAEFSKNGNITEKSYNDMLDTAYNKVEAAREEYEDYRKKHSKKKYTDKKKKKIEKQLKKRKQKYDEAQEALDKLKEKIDEYDETQDLGTEIADEINENVEQKIELQIEKFKVNIQAHLDFHDAKKQWIDFNRNVLQKTDIFKSRTNAFQDIILDMNKARKDLLNSFRHVADPNSSENTGIFQELTQHLKDTEKEIQTMQKGKTSSIYGDNMAKAMEDLKDYRDKLMDFMEQNAESIQAIKQGYLDTVDLAIQRLDELAEKRDYINELLQYQVDLMQLLYGERNYSAMDNYYNQIKANQNSEIEQLKRNLTFYKDEYDAALKASNEALMQKYSEAYKSTLSNLNSLVSKSMETLRAQYENTINKLFKDLDNTVTNGKGVDYLDMEWQLMNKNADSYLDAVNSIYGIESTRNKYQKAIDQTKNVKAQQNLKKVMEQQLKILKEKDKITQYDVDRAQKLLEIEKARIALEQAENNKTSMRLKRDAQGNYSYQFVADNEDVEDAKQALLDAQNDLYNFDKEAYQDNLNQMLSAWKDYQQQYKEILLDVSLTQQQRDERLKLIEEQYNQYVIRLAKDSSVIRTNIMSSAFDSFKTMYEQDKSAFALLSVENRKQLDKIVTTAQSSFKKMSEYEQGQLLGEMIPNWSSGINQMAIKISGKPKSLQTITKNAFEEMTKATNEYWQEVDDVAQKAGIDLEKLKTGNEQLNSSVTEVVDTQEKLTKTITNQVVAAKKLVTQVESLAKSYDKANQAALKTLQTSLALEQRQAGLEKAQKNQKTAASKKSSADTAVKNAAAALNDFTKKYGGNTQTQWAKAYQSDVLGQFYSLLKEAQSLQKKAVKYANKKNPDKKKIKEYNNQLKQMQKKLNDFMNGNHIQLGGFAQLSTIDGKQVIDPNWILNLSAFDYANSVSVDQSFMKNYLNKLQKQYNAKVNTYTNAQGASTVASKALQQANKALTAANSPQAFQKILAQIKKKYSFASGGYTGEWEGSNGRMAVLHKKELVLNENDTKNFLDGVKILRTVSSSLNANMFNQLNNINTNGIKEIAKTIAIEIGNKQLDQTVTIEASFPAVNSKKEIEEALSNLVNLAAQRALR